jgi:glycosyltransferase involved in cell wall biosynthesis
MNIAFLCTSPSWGGLEMNVLRLALRMRSRGHAIMFYARNGTPLYEKAQENNLMTDVLNIKQPYLAFAAAQQLAASLKKQGIGVLIFSYAKDNYVSSWAKYFFYKPLKLIYLQQMELGITKKGLVQTFIYRQLAAWIAPLHLLKKQVLANTYVPAHKIHVIPLGIDTEQFMPHETGKARARSLLHLPKQVFIAGIIGRVDPAKGQEYLIKAAAILMGRGTEVHVLIVGEESRGDTRRYPQYLQKLVQEWKIEKFVHFRPFTEQTEKAFAALDVFVMASLGETYGMVTLEAMASGLPVIGTNSGGTPELLDYGNLGMLVPAKNEHALADTLEKLADNKVLREQLGMAARQIALSRYGYQVQCEQLERLIDKIS